MSVAVFRNKHNTINSGEEERKEQSKKISALRVFNLLVYSVISVYWHTFSFCLCPILRFTIFLIISFIFHRYCRLLHIVCGCMWCVCVCVSVHDCFLPSESVYLALLMQIPDVVRCSTGAAYSEYNVK